MEASLQDIPISISSHCVCDICIRGKPCPSCHWPACYMHRQECYDCKAEFCKWCLFRYTEYAYKTYWMCATCVEQKAYLKCLPPPAEETMCTTCGSINQDHPSPVHYDNYVERACQDCCKAPVECGICLTPVSMREMVTCQTGVHTYGGICRNCCRRFVDKTDDGYTWKHICKKCIPICVHCKNRPALPSAWVNANSHFGWKERHCNDCALLLDESDSDDDAMK